MRQPRRAIFLISMMFIALLVAMFATAALSLAPASLTQGRQLADRQVAERAVRTGMDYAIARLRANGGAWRAQTAQTVGSLSSGLWVQEGDGQVEGWVKEGERWSRFRIRFNYLDGPGGADGMNDPAYPWTELHQLSFNNLQSNSSRPLPACDSTGSVSSASGSRFDVPAHTVVLAVEGCCGRVALTGGAPSGFSYTPSTLMGEGVLQISNPKNGASDAVVMAAGSLNFSVDKDQEVNFSNSRSQIARLRSRGSMSLDSQGMLTSPNGEVEGGWSGSNYDSKKITIKPADPKVSFYSINKDSTPTPSGANTVKGGVYEIDWDPTTQTPQVRYYDMTYADYWAQRTAGALIEATPGPPPAGFDVVDAKPGAKQEIEVQFHKDTQVTGSGKTKDLAIIPRQGAPTEVEAAAAAGAPSPPAGGAAPAATNVIGLANLLQATLFQTVPPTPGWDFTNSTWLPSPYWQVSANQGTMLSAAPLPSALVPIFQSVVSSGSSIPGMQFNGLFSSNPTVKIQNWDVSWDGTSKDNYQFGSLQLAQTLMTQAQNDPGLNAALSSYSGAPLDPVDPTKSGGLSVQDLTIRLIDDSTKGKDKNGAVTLRTEGSLLLGGKLKGNGASLIAGKDILLRGNGVSLSANQDNGLSIYAQGNIDINSFAYKLGGSKYENVDIKGVIYGWGNIGIRTGGMDKTKWADFKLTGAMVSYGKDPGDPTSPTNPTEVTLAAKSAKLVFDPTYLQNLLQNQVGLDTQFNFIAYHQH
ncbi:hypothetical protein JST97_16455 [bacterium]|nr:hypothetical protein [bacterium]